MIFTELWLRVVIARRKSVYVPSSRRPDSNGGRPKLYSPAMIPITTTKVDAIKQILSDLKEDEAFFSIDEYGPFAIKRKGGTKRVGPGENLCGPAISKVERLADPHGCARTIPKPNNPLSTP